MARSKRFLVGIRMLDSKVKTFYDAHPEIPNQEGAREILEQVYKIEKGYKTPTEIGIEVEIEKCIKLAELKIFHQENDGSLKDAGIEFISIPIKDDNVLYALEELEYIYNKTPKSVFSHRCSIHVHINVSKLTVGQLHALIATYLATENFFFSLVAPERRGNSFCYPLADLCITKEDIAPENIDEKFKYAALNPHHLVDFGTLEFRHHHGTKNKKELLNWIETILQLYRYVEKVPPLEIYSTIRELNTISNYYEFLKDVFEGKLQLFNVGLNFGKVLRNNITTAKIFLG